jgi:hypothetical protein
MVPISDSQLDPLPTEIDHGQRWLRLFAERAGSWRPRVRVGEAGVIRLVVVVGLVIAVMGMIERIVAVSVAFRLWLAVFAFDLELR